MSTVADKLRQAREAQKMTVYQVADITKIRTDHIRALEEGNFDIFSAPVYIRGFVRTYANLLKLNVPETMSILDQELGRTEKFSEPPPLSDEKRNPLDFVMLQLSKVDLRKGLVALTILAGVVVAILIVTALWRHWTSDPLSRLEPGVYQSPTNTSGETLPLPAAR